LEAIACLRDAEAKCPARLKAVDIIFDRDRGTEGRINLDMAGEDRLSSITIHIECDGQQRPLHPYHVTNFAAPFLTIDRPPAGSGDEERAEPEAEHWMGLSRAERRRDFHDEISGPRRGAAKFDRLLPLVWVKRAN
jgi:hypothetical protein